MWVGVLPLRQGGSAGTRLGYRLDPRLTLPRLTLPAHVVAWPRTEPLDEVRWTADRTRTPYLLYLITKLDSFMLQWEARQLQTARRLCIDRSLSNPNGAHPAV
jgi:hypothetical protein